MKKSFTQRVKEASLTPQEQRIAEKILHNLSRFAFLTGPQLAKECRVSASAITRFAQKLEYAGFPDLKIALEELFRQTITPYDMFAEYLSGPRSPSVWQESIAQDLQNIMNMQQRRARHSICRQLQPAKWLFVSWGFIFASSSKKRIFPY